MESVLKRIVYVLALIVVVFGVTGCTFPEIASPFSSSCEDEQKVNVVLVVTPCRNQPGTDVGVVGDYVRMVADTRGELAVVSAEGAPRVVLPHQIIGSDDPSETSRSLQNANISADVTTQIASLKAVSPEVDFVSALNLANREAASMNGETKIVIFGSGLQTTGLVLFQKGFIEAKAEEVAGFYGGEMPSLEGANVEWRFCGDTVEPQQPLTFKQVENVKSIWQALVTSAGGTVEFKDDNPVAAADQDSLPDVTCVDVPAPIEYVFGEGSGVVSLPDNEVFGFIPGTADLVNPSGALSTIRGLIAQYPGTMNAAVTVIGYTASLPTESESVLYELGFARAKAICDILVDAGISGENIVCESRGARDNLEADGSWNDIDPVTGLQVPEKAQENRKVVINFG